MFTKSCNSLNWIKFTLAKYFKGAGNCLLNCGISLNWDSLNQDLSVLGSFYEAKYQKVSYFRKNDESIFSKHLFCEFCKYTVGQKMEKLLQELMFCTIYCNVCTKT